MKRVGQSIRENLVEKIKTGVSGNSGVFLVSYDKMDSNKIGDFRKSLNKSGAQVFVSKNSIARVALKELQHEDLGGSVLHQTAFVWTNADSVEVSKVLVKYAKDNEHLNVKGGILDGRLLTDSDIQRLSELPSKGVLYAQLLGVMQAPITRFMSACNAKSRDLLSILKQLSEKKGGN